MKSNIKELVTPELVDDFLEEDVHSPGLYNLAILRRLRGLTLKTLAQRLGVSENSVWHIERSAKKGQPILASLVNYLDALGYGLTLYSVDEDMRSPLFSTDSDEEVQPLRVVRSLRNLTQATLAELMESNIMNVSNIERTAVHELSINSMQSYIDALSMTVDAMFWDKGDPGDEYSPIRNEHKHMHSLGELREGVIQEQVGQELNITAGRISHRERSTIGELPVKFVANYLSAIGHKLTMTITSQDGSLYEIVHDGDNFAIVPVEGEKVQEHEIAS